MYMTQTDFVKKLKDIDTNAYTSIIEVFKTKGITELDINNKAMYTPIATMMTTINAQTT